MLIHLFGFREQLQNVIRNQLQLASLLVAHLLFCGCSVLVGIEDECNVDEDCSILGPNSKCRGHLCFENEIDTLDETGPDSISGTNDSSSEGDTMQGMDSRGEPDTLRHSDPDTDTDSDPDTDTIIGSTIFVSYPFTDGLDGFSGTESVFTHEPKNGLVRIEHEFAGPNEFYYFRRPLDGINWTGATHLNILLRVEQSFNGGLLPYFFSGSGNWCGKWYSIPTDSNWITLTIALDKCDDADISMMQEIGLQIRTLSKYSPPELVRLQIDEIFVTKPEPSDGDVGDAIESGEDVSMNLNLDAQRHTDTQNDTNIRLTIENSTDSTAPTGRRQLIVSELNMPLNEYICTNCVSTCKTPFASQRYWGGLDSI